MQNGFTPLHISAKKNQVGIVSILLDFGVEADQTTKGGISPLHLAAQQGNVEILDLLLDNGASPGVQTYVRMLFYLYSILFLRIFIIKAISCKRIIYLINFCRMG